MHYGGSSDLWYRWQFPCGVALTTLMIRYDIMALCTERIAIAQ